MPAMVSSGFLVCLYPILFTMINQVLGQDLGFLQNHFCINGTGTCAGTTNRTYQTNLNRLLSSLPSD
ncbi:hypothetical protein ACFX13_005216 [Malus domestica]